MSWLPILLLAAVTFVIAVYWLKLARSLWMLFGSAMLFGLTKDSVIFHQYYFS